MPPAWPMPQHRNAATQCSKSLGLVDSAQAMGMSANQAYQLALRAERARPARATPGFRLYWMTSRELGSIDLGAGSAPFLVVGRHTQCDVVLRADPTVALRHVLVRAEQLDDGCALLHVLDLHTHNGFVLADGTSERSMATAEPVFLRVGAYGLVALPSGVALPEELAAPTAERRAAPPYRVKAAPVAPSPHPIPCPWPSPSPSPSPRAPHRPAPASHITLMPRPVDLSERAPNASGAGDYELVLHAAERSAGVRLSVDDLDRGVLVGRAPRCVDAGLQAVLNMAISRVHLLLIRDRLGCTAYDLASTQGTYHDARRVRSLALADSGTALGLAMAGSVQLHWRGLAAAASS